MDLCCCKKCSKWFDVNDSYDEILIAEKSSDSYVAWHFCQECGKKMRETITTLLNESEDNNV